MFEVLMFIFENYMDNNISLKTDSQTILTELEKVGFSRNEINNALNWLDGLNQSQLLNSANSKNKSIRHYIFEEHDHIGIKGIGFLSYLENIGVLDPISREIVIDRIMALSPDDISLGRIKWIALMVLFSQPNKKSALSILQDMVLHDAFDVMH